MDLGDYGVTAAPNSEVVLAQVGEDQQPAGNLTYTADLNIQVNIGEHVYILFSSLQCLNSSSVSSCEYSSLNLFSRQATKAVSPQFQHNRRLCIFGIIW